MNRKAVLFYFRLYSWRPLSCSARKLILERVIVKEKGEGKTERHQFALAGAGNRDDPGRVKIAICLRNTGAVDPSRRFPERGPHTGVRGEKEGKGKSEAGNDPKKRGQKIDALKRR